MIHGAEYAFSARGVLKWPRPEFGSPKGKFDQRIVVGVTTLTEEEIDRLLVHAHTQWVGSGYHLIERNCNHFTDHICFALTGLHAPVWINRTADNLNQMRFTEELKKLQRLHPPQGLTSGSPGEQPLGPAVSDAGFEAAIAAGWAQMMERDCAEARERLRGCVVCEDARWVSLGETGETKDKFMVAKVLLGQGEELELNQGSLGEFNERRWQHEWKLHLLAQLAEAKAALVQTELLVEALDDLELDSKQEPLRGSVG